MHTITAWKPSVPNPILLAALLLSFTFGTTANALADAAIHAGDKVRVTVYNHPDLSIDTVVDGNGAIVVPIAGNIEVEGLQPSTAGFRVALALQPSMRRPSVEVRVIEQMPSIYFTGSQIGVQPFQPGETLTTAIASLSSKGTDNFIASALDLRGVELRRDGKSIGKYDVAALARAGDPGPRLQSGDVIELAAKPVRVDVGGMIKNPGPIYLYPKETLAQAVELSGGFLPDASYTNVVLHRAGVDEPVSAAGVAFTTAAHDGDVLTVQPAPRVSVLGMVESSKNLTLQGDPTLLAALYLAGGPNKWADVKHIKVVRHGVVAGEYNISGLTHGDVSSNTRLQDGDVVFVPEGHRIDPTMFLRALDGLSTVKYLTAW